MNFGATLKAAREEAGLLQADLAEQADLNPSYLSQLENNRKSPTLTVYFRLCNVLRITPSALMRRVEQEEAPAKQATRRPRRR